MKKSLSILLGLIAAAILVLATNGYANGGGGSAADCQYPTRPLVNGNCDNTDPANPENIKGEVVKPKKKDKPNVFIPEKPKPVRGCNV